MPIPSPHERAAGSRLPRSRGRRRLPLATALVLLAGLTPVAYFALSTSDQVTDRAKARVPLPPKPWLAPIAPRNPAPPHVGAELCEQDGVRCPDLAMRAPYQFVPDVRGGRRVLRVANAVLSIGPGAVEVRGTRDGARTMRAVQYVERDRGGPVRVAGNAGRLIFKAIPGQGRIWKYEYAAKFELWTTGAARRIVRTGPKLTYCLRDLRRLWDWKRTPRAAVYPACSHDDQAQRVTLGTSPGWADIYPATYYQQWIDVQGLRGCFDLIHVADPRNRIIETDETNNASKTRIRLPMGRTAVARC